MEVFGFIVVWTLFGIGVAALADSRGRSGFGYFLLSFFFSPLLGLIVVLITKNLKEEAANEDWRRREQENRDFDRKREHEKQLESLRVLAATQNKNPPSTIPIPSMSSTADELAKLAELRDRGILTPEEFDQQKRALLSRAVGSVAAPPPSAPVAAPAALSTEQGLQAILIEQIRAAGYSVESPKSNHWEIRGPRGTSYASDDNLHRVISELLRYAPGGSKGTSHAA